MLHLYWPAVDRDGYRLSDLDYADDIVLLETSQDTMQQLTETIETEGKKIGLQMNVKKCKTLVSDSWEDSGDKNWKYRGRECGRLLLSGQLVQPMATATKTVKPGLSKCVSNARRCMEEQTHQQPHDGKWTHSPEEEPEGQD